MKTNELIPFSVIYDRHEFRLFAKKNAGEVLFSLFNVLSYFIPMISAQTASELVCSLIDTIECYRYGDGHYELLINIHGVYRLLDWIGTPETDAFRDCGLRELLCSVMNML